MYPSTDKRKVPKCTAKKVSVKKIYPRYIIQVNTIVIVSECVRYRFVLQLFFMYIAKLIYCLILLSGAANKYHFDNQLIC